MTDTTYRLRITEVDRDLNAFWDLGEITHEVPTKALFDSLPAAPDDKEADYSYVADLLDQHGDLVNDRLISAEMAQTLLDEPIPVLRERFRKWLWETCGATG